MRRLIGVSACLATLAVVALPALASATSQKRRACPVVSGIAGDNVHHGNGKKDIIVRLDVLNPGVPTNTMKLRLTAIAKRGYTLCGVVVDILTSNGPRRTFRVAPKTPRTAVVNFSKYPSDPVSIKVTGRRLST
ncbi:MAG TPA: hypothetical protein VHZ75_08840 [Solirubrobacteraceae bacterium]|jgi:hypothetical protein|nr:hypothetical protein [Solirubrobacteraceae bacterium]